MSSEFVVENNYNSDYRSPLRFIWSHARRHKLPAIGLVVGAFSNAALAAAVPYLIGLAFTRLDQGTEGGIEFVLLIVGAILASQTVRALLMLVRNFSAEVFAQRFERDIRDELYANLLGKSMTFHDMLPVGETMARVTNDVREMNFMMNPGVNLIVGSSMFLIVPVLASPFIHPALVVVPIGFLVIHAVIQYFFLASLHPIAQNVRISFGQMNGRLAEALDGIQVVKGAAQEDQEITTFNKLADNVKDYYISQSEVEARYLSFFLFGLSFVAAFIHAAVLFNADMIAFGDIVAYIGLIYLFGFPVFVSLFSLSRIASGYASAGRILSLLTMKTDLDQNPEGYADTLKGAITFENVDFGYQEGGQVLHDISFTIQPGQTVAIVGQTGAGKTTLTKLINRIYDVSKGRVLVDGVDVREWNLASLRSQISIIEQDIFLFSRTIAENIAFGVDNATQEQIENSAKMAQAHDFIQTFAEGYETVIGQRGVTLSGGQRQRLAIARAFQTDPPVLILDDSTSAIDSATEDKIQQAIWTAAKGRTTILITHRLSQIRWADHIIVLKQGHVVAQGSHDDLLQSSESYRRIFARHDEPTEQNGSQPIDALRAN